MWRFVPLNAPLCQQIKEVVSRNGGHVGCGMSAGGGVWVHTLPHSTPTRPPCDT